MQGYNFSLKSEFGFVMISGAILTINIYNPPEKSPYRISDETLVNFIHYCLIKYFWNTAKDILFLGDFNVPSVNWTTFPAESPREYVTFFNFLLFSNCLQIFDEPTHILGNTLDVAFIKFSPGSVEFILEKIPLSDHCLLEEKMEDKKSHRIEKIKRKHSVNSSTTSILNEKLASSLC